MSDRIDTLEISGEGTRMLVAALTLALDPWPTTGKITGVTGWREVEDTRPLLAAVQGRREDRQAHPRHLLWLVRRHPHSAARPHLGPGDGRLPHRGVAGRLLEAPAHGAARVLVTPYDNLRRPDTDGSYNKGWHVRLDCTDDILVAPHYVVYGK